MSDDEGNLDNFVPRFAPLATVQVTPVVLVGVWLIFLPVTLGAAVAFVSYWLPPSDLFASLVASIPPLFIFTLASAILLRTTRRYLYRTSNRVKGQSG